MIRSGCFTGHQFYGCCIMSIYLSTEILWFFKIYRPRFYFNRNECIHTLSHRHGQEVVRRKEGVFRLPEILCDRCKSHEFVSRIEMFTNSTRKADHYKEPKKNVQQRRKAFDGHWTQAPTPGQNTCNSPELWIPVIDQCRSLNHVELQSGSLLCAKTEDIWV